MRMFFERCLILCLTASVSGTCCTLQSKLVPSIIARLALSESCFAKLLSIVMKMHIRELQRMDIALVRKSWTSVRLNPFLGRISANLHV